MIEFTPQFAIERGYNLKRLSFYLSGKKIHMVSKAYVPEEMGLEAQGWIEHANYEADENGNPKFVNGLPVWKPKDNETYETNEMAQDVLNMPKLPVSPEMVQSAGLVKWIIEDEPVETKEQIETN